MGAPESRAALLRFALEANARMRLTRLTVVPEAGQARVRWDVVLPRCVELERALPAAIEAVVGGHAASHTALRALAHPVVARAYLTVFEATQSEGEAR
jgi:hypothetical protein